METEKTKAKAHPFAGYLQPDEEVLWMMVKPPPSVGKGVFLSIVGFIAVCIAMLVMSLPTPNQYPYMDMKLYGRILPYMMCFLGLITLPCFLFAIRHFVWLSRQPFDYAYAVTSDRLMYRRRDRVLFLALDEAQVRQMSSASLSFGINFPRWHNIDAAAVKQMIERAQQDL